ncbi:hypothetical protein B296_00053791 [Ensete ventricosum]|uniref:Uncharacterized protein n=1 Tax=Ensete ventricosum TaxID=4639 RepID=A0A426XT96_ENSVE|nr:hypothetical protein B296_00053791 [Ensete ventricosum]
MAASRASAPPPPLPPAAAKKGFLRRVLPFVLTANLAVGGPLYLVQISIYIPNLYFFSPSLGLRVVRARITATARSSRFKEVKLCLIAPRLYAFLSTSKNESVEKDAEVAGDVVPAATIAATKSVIHDKKPIAAPIPAPTKVLPPIAEQEQRELFKWILEEKRKVKLSDMAEKKKIDDEKALLKQFIRAKSIPSI